MSTNVPPALGERMAEVRRPVVPPPMPRASPLVSLATSPMLHRLLPPRLAVLIGEARGAMLWHTRPPVREAAHLTMQAIVGGTERAHEAARLARRFVLEKNALTMIFWQPPRKSGIDEPSRANLQSALASGRGIVLSATHLGPFFDVGSPLVDVSRRVYVSSGGWFFLAPTADYAGRRLAHWWRKPAARKQQLVSTGGSSEILRTVLEQGEIALLFFDVSGSRETIFLGKPVHLATGTARLAIETDAVVLPARARQERGRGFVDFAPPLDARQFADVGKLQDALAAIHSELILEHPETLEDPRRSGAWEHGATAEAWVSPATPASKR